MEITRKQFHYSKPPIYQWENHYAENDHAVGDGLSSKHFARSYDVEYITPDTLLSSITSAAEAKYIAV